MDLLSSLTEEERGRLTCFLCSSVMTDPRKLDCGHSYCYFCIRQLNQRSNSNGEALDCPRPSCGSVTRLGPTGLLRLPPDEVLKDEIERCKELSAVRMNVDSFRMAEFQRTNRPVVPEVTMSLRMMMDERMAEEKRRSDEARGITPGRDVSMSMPPGALTSGTPDDYSRSTCSPRPPADADPALPPLGQEVGKKKRDDDEEPSAPSVRRGGDDGASRVERAADEPVPSPMSVLESHYPETTLARQALRLISEGDADSLEGGWEDIATKSSVSLEMNIWEDVANGLKLQHYNCGTLILEVIEARDLYFPTDTIVPNEEVVAGCDPYLLISSPVQGLWSRRTSWKPSTRSPLWQEYFIFDFDENGRNKAPDTIRLEVWNSNYVQDQFLGMVQIPLSVAAARHPVSQWWSLLSRPGKTERISGQVHVRIHYRKRYDLVSEAAAEIRLINDIIEEEDQKLAMDRVAGGGSDERRAAMVQARVEQRVKKVEKLREKKRTLVEQTLLEKPISDFEVNDTNNSYDSEAVAYRFGNVQKLLETACEEMSVFYKYPNAFKGDLVKRKQWEESRQRLQLRIHYLLELYCSLFYSGRPGPM
mmetsp:Transcript_24484/g.68628  ORF Transcript_24484/g.68628 Transcript_24484/m.68628 type:complete len:590 (-) Transcript_24484:185-1954(-)